MRRNQVLIGAIVGVAVFYAIAIIALGSPPDASASGAEVVQWFGRHDDGVRVAVWCTTFAMVFMGVFAAYVRGALPKPYADIFFVGAITLIAETIVQSWILAGLALHPRSVQPSTARLALDIANYWGPVLISATILMLAPIVVLAFRGEAGLPRWLGWLAGIALAEQVVESITIFGTRGFTEPGGAMNLELGAGLTTIALLATGLVIAVRREPVPA